MVVDSVPPCWLWSVHLSITNTHTHTKHSVQSALESNKSYPNLREKNNKPKRRKKTRMFEQKSTRTHTRLISPRVVRVVMHDFSHTRSSPPTREHRGLTTCAGFCFKPLSLALSLSLRDLSILTVISLLVVVGAGGDSRGLLKYARACVRTDMTRTYRAR